MMNQKVNLPLLNLGFRAFFALAGLFALIAISLWTSLYDGSLNTDNYYPIIYWHAHEMLFGYTVAVIAGFLLTAVKNWTGIQTANDSRLAWLCILWLYGRIVPFYSELLPDGLIAAIDFCFLPVLIYFVAKPILQSKNYRNLFVVALLLLMAFSNALIHAEILGFSNNTAELGFTLSIAIIIMLILIIAGRVFPFFTERGLKGVIAIRNPIIDIACIALSMLVFALVLFKIQGILLAAIAISAVVANIVRIAGWYVHRIWYVPLLWVLYIGYAWIIMGFLFIAFSALSFIPYSIALHAFTVGGIAVLTLGMMARVSLGHTGRALKASNTIAIAFVLINFAALCRVIMPAVLPDWYGSFLMFATYSWLMAFSFFIYIYLPILCTPRIDGQAG